MKKMIGGLRIATWMIAMAEMVCLEPSHHPMEENGPRAERSLSPVNKHSISTGPVEACRIYRLGSLAQKLDLLPNTT
jgi:hypothetical protein